jgi:hypothetical protein
MLSKGTLKNSFYTRAGLEPAPTKKPIFEGRGRFQTYPLIFASSINNKNQDRFLKKDFISCHLVAAFLAEVVPIIETGV